MLESLAKSLRHGKMYTVYELAGHSLVGTLRKEKIELIFLQLVRFLLNLCLRFYFKGRWRDWLGKKKSYVASETHVLMPSYGEINGAENLSDRELAAYMQSDAMKKVRERYRIKEGYCVRELCGEGLVIPISRDTINENQMAILSPVGMFLWDRLEKGQTFGDLLTALLAEYDVSREEAVKDIEDFLSELDAHQYLATVEENTQ